MANNIIKTFTIQVDTKSGKIAVDGLTKNFVKAETAFKKLNAEVQNVTTTGLNPLTGATGLAGAAVTELGRTISDVNYGFPAVANNISQLGSLFTILTAKAGGAKEAFALMKKEMKGPLGILLAFQVLITILEAISKGFFDTGKEASKAAEELKKLKGELAGNIVVANQYLKILEDTNTSERKRASIIEELKDLVPSLRDEDFKYGQQLDIVRQKIIDYSIAQASRIEIDKLVEENSELLAKRRRINLINDIKNEEEKTEAIKKFAKEEQFLLESTTSLGYAANSKMVEKSTEDIKKSFEDRSKTTIEESDKILEKINQLSNGFEFGYVKEKKASKLRKDFIAKELSFADEILKSQDEVNKKITKNQFTRLEQENKLQSDLAQIRFDNYKIREQARVASIKDPEDRAKAEIKSAEAIKKSEQSLKDFKVQLENETSAKILQITIEQAVKQLNILDTLNAKEREAILSFEASMATNELDKIDAEKRLEEEKLKNKLDALDKEKQKRIENGELYNDITKKEEQAVNASERQKTKFKEKEEKTKLAIANQVSEAIIGIAGEGSAVGKAVAVAMAIMNTKEAITAALGAKPYGPWNIAQAVAVGAFGMKQVQEIMSTKLPVEAAGGGGVGSISVSAPDFNVVGQGAGSQLAGVVGARFGEPIKAYVLSSDVSSAQELDRKIDSTATIG